MACVFCYMPYVFPRMTKHGGEKGYFNVFESRAEFYDRNKTRVDFEIFYLRTT